MSLNETIAGLAQAALSNDSQFLVDVVVSSRPPQKVTIVVDGDAGLTIDDCAAVSRVLLKSLEEQKLVGDQFTLEVTTPGVDHPLRMRRQYVKNVGRNVRIQRKDKSVEVGRLMAVSNDTVTLEQEEKEGKTRIARMAEVPFSDIERTIVQVSFK